MSKTREEIAALPPYERKAYFLFCEMCDIDDIKPPHIVSYLCKRNRGDPEVTGKVFEPPPADYNKNVPLTYVISRLNEKLYTKNKKLRKKYVDMQPWESYLVGSLMMLCNEAWCEKQKDVSLSWQELKWLREN